MKRKLFGGVATVALTLGMATMANATLIAHWSFDETGGSTAYDSVGSVNGALTGGASFTTTGGVVGGAVEIGSGSGYVSMGNNFPATSAFSIEAWVNIEPGNTTGMVPVSKHWATVTSGYILTINNVGDGYTATNTAGFYSANGWPYQTAVGGPAVNDGAWHQLVGVYDNGTASIYIDGGLAASVLTGYSDIAADFIVGGFFNASGTPINAYAGLIDEVRVYDNALTGTEVGAIYNNTINPTTPVPEPSTFLLIGSGLAGAVLYRARLKGIFRKRS